MPTAISTGTTVVITKDNGGASPVTSITMGALITAWRLTGISAAEIDTTQLSSLAKTCVLGVVDRGMIEFDMYVERSGTSLRAIVQRSLPTTDDGNWAGNITNPAWDIELSWEGVLQSVTYNTNIDEAVTATYAVRLQVLTVSQVGSQ